jgi:hypothetical protein
MKYNIYINQVGIVKAGLHTETTCLHWAVVDYIGGFVSSKKKTIIHNEKEMVWINYSHLAKQLPLFPTLKHISNVSKCFKKLKDLDLIITKKKGDNLYVRLTEKAISIKYFKDDDRYLKDNTTVIKKITNTNTKDNKLSKDSKTSVKSTEFITSSTKAIIEKWNLQKVDYPHLKKTDVKKKTNTNQDIQKYIKQLKKGTFLKGKVLNKELIKFNNIPKKMKPMSIKEIQETIRTMLKYLIDGYSPVSKKSVGSLSEMIYSRHFQSSYFLQALYNAPNPIQATKDPDPKASEYLITHLGFEVPDYQKLYHGVKSIQDFVNNIPKKSMDIRKIKGEVGTTLRMCKKYTYWLDHQDWIDSISIPILNTNNKLWKKFIKELEDDYQGNRLWDK